MRDQFKADLFQDLGIDPKHPKAQQFFKMVWKQGQGFLETYQCAKDTIQLAVRARRHAPDRLAKAARLAIHAMRHAQEDVNLQRAIVDLCRALGEDPGTYAGAD